MDYTARLTTEHLEVILTLAITGGEPMAYAEQTAASMSLVSSEWHAVMHGVGWSALILRRLGRPVKCESEDAMWLLRLLRRVREPTLTATDARTHLKLTQDDLTPHRDGAVPAGNGVGRRYDVALLVEVAVSKHGGVGGFRAHVTRCQVRRRGNFCHPGLATKIHDACRVGRKGPLFTFDPPDDPSSAGRRGPRRLRWLRGCEKMRGNGRWTRCSSSSNPKFATSSPPVATC